LEPGSCAQRAREAQRVTTNAGSDLGFHRSVIIERSER
jgi:hypothetical protein